MSVNNLRKQSEKEEVINLAKLLIKKWKKLLPAEGILNCSSFVYEAAHTQLPGLTF